MNPKQKSACPEKREADKCGHIGRYFLLKQNISAARVKSVGYKKRKAEYIGVHSFQGLDAAGSNYRPQTADKIHRQ